MNELSAEYKNAISINIISILEQWNLADTEQLTLLNQQDIKTRHLYLYRRGDRVFEFDDDFIARAQMILGIYESLGTTYPTNGNYGAIWLRRKQRKFKGKTPLDLMLSGKMGMKRVWHLLDCTQSWKD